MWDSMVESSRIFLAIKHWQREKIQTVIKLEQSLLKKLTHTIVCANSSYSHCGLPIITMMVTLSPMVLSPVGVASSINFGHNSSQCSLLKWCSMNLFGFTIHQSNKPHWRICRGFADSANTCQPKTMASPQDSRIVHEMGFAPLNPVDVSVGLMTVKLVPKIVSLMTVLQVYKAVSSKTPPHQFLAHHQRIWCSA